GSQQWTTARTTDAQGHVTFDLEGLGSGINYVLRTAPYNGGYVYSSETAAPGNITFPVGELPVTVLAGDGSGPLVNIQITLSELMPDGTLTDVKSGHTDASGLIIFDAPNIGTGRIYVVRANSPHDGTRKQSSPIVSKGAITFTVGNAPLNVTLANSLTGQPLAGQEIVALKIL
ncbi:MAG: hypothetical protein GY934_22915, partial [Gammaproteobacteria bacterium]|nr:hypothetical protein [Gammaproteobacteria bacterium]